MTDCFFDTAAAMVAADRPEDPVYCLRPHVLHESARRFTTLFPGTVLYAVKCNDDPRVLRALHDGGVRHFDVASVPEIALVRALLPEAQCAYMHPVKSRRAIAEAYHRHGVRCFALDHEDELAKIIDATGGAHDLTLMVRLDVPRNQALYDLSGKFGAAPAEAAALLRAARAPGRRLGLTFHVGSQCLRPAAFRRAIDLAGQTVDAAGIALDVLDVGGGFPVPYVACEPPPLEDYIAAIRDGVDALGLPPGCALWCEPGRALVAEACSVVVRVELRKGEALYINDGIYGSLSDLEIDGIDFPMRAIRPDTGSDAGAREGPAGRLAGFRLFGPTCDSFDRMSGPHWLPEDIREGDWIEIGQAGAYAAVLRTRFNGFHPERVVTVADGALRPVPWLAPARTDRQAAE